MNAASNRAEGRFTFSNALALAIWSFLMGANFINLAEAVVVHSAGVPFFAAGFLIAALFTLAGLLKAHCATYQKRED